MIGFTTGRQTNQRLNSLLKELVHSLPKARVIRRGKSSLEDLGWHLFEEGFEYVVILQRWQGGPGRIDFFKVEAQGLARRTPSVLLKAVKLRREYANPEKHTAEAITCDTQASRSTQRFVSYLSPILNLTALTLPTSSEIKSTLHITETRDGSILLALTSPPAQQEVGPRLLISRLIWDMHE